MTPEITDGLDSRPVIALLTEIKEGESPDFGKVHSFCEELHQGLSERGGSFFVFPLAGFKENGIEGYFYEDEEWKKGFLPFPDVIYNRIASRRTEFSKAFKGFLNKLNSRGIKIFNSRFFSKWEIHEFLQQEEHLLPYLPETRIYTEHALHAMLEKYDDLYIKPVHGSQGREIIRLREEGEQYYPSFSSIPEKQYPAFVDIAAFAKGIGPRAAKQLHIIQQGIQLSELNGRKMDFRVLCHKNAQHFWKVTSIVARISAKEYFVSNIARGGEVMRPLQTLSLIFGRDQAKHQIALMKELALETAEAISLHADGHTAELGIDIGIDIRGNLWLIEANSKPSKNFEEHSTKLRPSTKAIIEHCCALAEE